MALRAAFLCASAGTAGIALALADDEVPIVTSRDIVSDNYIRKFVRFTGRVTDQFLDDTNPGYYFATLEDDFGSVVFSTLAERCPSMATNDYTECIVSIVGRNEPTLVKDKGARKYIFHELQLIRSDGFTVIEKPKSDPFDVPLLEADTAVAPEGLAALGRRKLQGLVLAVRDPNGIMMLTSSGMVSRVELRTKSLPAAGDSVEAAGVVETDTYFLNLSRARWRRIPQPPATAPAPKELTARQIMSNEGGRTLVSMWLQGMPVKTRAIVRSLPDPDFGRRLVFAESDGVTFPIDASCCPQVVAKLERGTTIDVTGVCWIDIDNWRPTAIFPQAVGFSLVLRLPDDIAVLSQPPWWTPERLLAVIAALLAILIAILVWNRVLGHTAKRLGERLFGEESARMSAEIKAAERSRLAIELHDSISQILTGVAMKLKAARTTARTDIEKSLAEIDFAERALRSSRDELRNCIWDLRNDILDIKDIGESVRRMLKPCIGAICLSVDMSMPRQAIPDAIAHETLKIIRELAVNAVRHGAATEISISGRLENGTLSFSVRDNGSGFDEGAAPGPEHGHFGILGIRDRLARYGGTLKIQGSRNAGTEVAVSMRIGMENTEAKR